MSYLSALTPFSILLHSSRLRSLPGVQRVVELFLGEYTPADCSTFSPEGSAGAPSEGTACSVMTSPVGIAKGIRGFSGLLKPW